MKTFSGTFANGQKYMGVEVPEDGFDFRTQYEDKYTFLYGRDKSEPVNSPMSGDVDYDESPLGIICETRRKNPIPKIEILGKYHTEGKIDFPIKENWLESTFGVYRNYNEKHWAFKMQFFSPFDSILSLLDRDSRQAFPLEENPQKENFIHGEGVLAATNNYYHHEQYVRPKTFLIILVK